MLTYCQRALVKVGTGAVANAVAAPVVDTSHSVVPATAQNASAVGDTQSMSVSTCAPSPVHHTVRP